jgi:hypothetical protein
VTRPAAARRPSPAARPGADAGGRPDGGSSAAELVLVLPALMLVVALVVQVILWGLASHAVQASAATAGDVARGVGGTPGAAVAAARSELASVAGGLVDSPDVVATSIAGGESVVVVSGTVPSLIPGVHLTVSATSIGPFDQFRGSG